MKHTDGGTEISGQASLYALGALPTGEIRDFEAHLETGCEECAAELEPARFVVAALGLAAKPQEPPAHIRERLLQRLAQASAAPSVPTNSFVTIRAQEGEWREVFKGVTVKQLFADQERGTVTSLFRVGPGAHIPPHNHAGLEQCLILEGDFSLNGEVYGPGDFTCAMQGSAHDLSYSKSGALLLIVAAAGYRMSAHPTA